MAGAAAKSPVLAMAASVMVRRSVESAAIESAHRVECWDGEVLSGVVQIYGMNHMPENTSIAIAWSYVPQAGFVYWIKQTSKLWPQRIGSILCLLTLDLSYVTYDLQTSSSVCLDTII